MDSLNTFAWRQAVVGLAVLMTCAVQASAQIRQVHVTGGRIEGVAVGDIAVFKGIPFAAPPVGARRWAPPQPVVPWSGVRWAVSFAPACAQVPLGLPGVKEPPPLLRQSEDCLYLNVWTGARTPRDKRPVMVWIYGGGFAVGATSSPIYDGTQFARQGVVFVSIAYRLGPFGFLADPDLSRESGHGSGNYGLRDQIAALEWVKDNIAKFGGDPTRMTVFGESAGAMSVSLLSASAAARGLFQRAIAESGAVFSPPRAGAVPFPMLQTLQLAEATGRTFLRGLGADNLRAARALPAAMIIKAAQAGPFDRFWADIDGDVVLGDNYTRYEAGRFNDIPVLVGTNSDEGETEHPAPSIVTPTWFVNGTRTSLGPAATDILAVYPHRTNAETLRAVKSLNRDGEFGWQAWTWARLQSQHGRSPVYMYYFDVRTRTSPDGAVHGAEVPYVFGNFGVTDAVGMPGPAASAVALRISRTIQRYWVNFAITGDPNGAGLPNWPRFSESDPRVMAVDASLRATALPNGSQLQALNRYFAWRRTQFEQQAAQLRHPPVLKSDLSPPRQ